MMKELPIIVLIDPNDTRAVRSEDNVLALYDLMINLYRALGGGWQAEELSRGVESGTSGGR